MGGMRELISLLRGIDDQLSACMRCGMCQAVCPLYAETGLEAHVARGKIALLSGLADEVIKDPVGVKERLDLCLLCGACQASCPSGVHTLDIFLAARAFLTGYAGLSPVKQAVLRGMLAHPKLFDRLMALAGKCQRLAIKPANEAVGTAKLRFFPSLAEGRHFPPLADVPLHDRLRGQAVAAGKSGLRVALFTGCVVDKMFPHIGEAAIEALEHHGVTVIVPQGQACCGIPALSSGDRETCDKLIAANLEAFDGVECDAVVTACATCTSTIRKVWPSLAGGLKPTSRYALSAMAAKTTDISAFLVDVLGVGAEGAPTPEAGAIPVTYHDPCHLKKSLGIAAQPRALIRANPRYRLVEMAGADACCGSGGSFTLQHYDLSRAIGARKREAIETTGASVVATSCPACMMQIGDLLSQAGDRVAIRHPVEIYNEMLPKKRP